METKTRVSPLERLANRIKRENAKFKKMTNAEKRVVIAKDCIKRIRFEQIIPDKGVLIDRGTCSLEGSISETVNYNEDFYCDGCAKGGLFISYIGRVNDFNFQEIGNYGHEHDSNPMQKLLEIFSEDQLSLIEAAFEDGQVINYYANGNKIDVGIGFDTHTLMMERAEDFSHGFEYAEYRLIAICENIIENKGTFKI